MSTTIGSPAEEATAEPAGRGLKKIMILALVVALVAGGVYWFLFRPAPEPKEPEPGEVTALEPIQVNLEAGHYLRIGIALQMSIEVAEELDGSKALDALIDVYTGEDVEDLADVEKREELREELVKKVEHLYEDEVLDVYITEFVTQ